MANTSEWTNEVKVRRCKLDSHADACCFGGNSTVISTDRYHTADVTLFSDDLGKLVNVPIATISVVYDCLNTFCTIILVFHQVLFIPTLKNHLLCPNQLQSHNVTVNEYPLQFIPRSKRTHEDHAIIIGDIIFPLMITGVTSYFNVRKPNEVEWNEDVPLRHVNVTLTDFGTQ
jgi:hypothetical protein